MNIIGIYTVSRRFAADRSSFSYELDGDTFKVFSATPGKARPMEFTSKKDSGHTLMIWEREKKK